MKEIMFSDEEFQLLRRDISLVWRAVKDGLACSKDEMSRIINEIDKKKGGKKYEQQVID
jgi:hypothetical protein